MESHTATILVAEDDRNSAMLMVDLLKAHGYRVISEATGRAAISRVKEDPVDLAILDLRLPEQNGFMAAEAIRRNPATACIPIIVVSAYNDRQNRMSAYRSGANVILSKPVDPAELILVTANLLTLTGQNPGPAVAPSTRIK